MQKNSFITIHRTTFVCCAHCLPGTSTQGGWTGWHQNTLSEHHEVGEKVIINEPTWTQVGHTLVKSSLVFSRFNLKHKQRPDPSKKGAFIKQAVRTKAEKHLHSTIA